MSRKKTTWWVCDECGANVPPSSAVCWLCHRGIRPFAPPLGPFREDRTTGEMRLATALFALTLGAVLMGAFLLAPGLGILAVILIGPAFIRTCLWGFRGDFSERRRRREGRDGQLGNPIAEFAGKLLATLMTLVLLAVAGVVGLFLFCAVLAVTLR